MRSISRLIAAAAIVLSAGSAYAADAVTDEAPVPAPIEAIAPTYIWSGPYAGAFVGYNWSDFNQSSGPSYDGEGMVGGVYAGYNLQTDQLVYGLEGDIGYSGLDAGGFNSTTGAPVSSDDNAFGSIRARVGYAYDPFLLFATGGLAVENKELLSNGVEDSNTHVGYTVGAGVEAQVTDDIAARVEYRYSDFGSKDYDFGTTKTSTGFDENSIRAGVALKF